MADNPDAFDLRPDGTILLNFGRDQVTLRRPNLREYRELVEAAISMRTTVTNLVQTGEDGEIKVDLEKDQEVYHELTNLSLGWLKEVVTTLGNGPWPADDDLPSWVLSPEIAKQILEHWQRVPSRHGAR